jgi:hypothetical protein
MKKFNVKSISATTNSRGKSKHKNYALLLALSGAISGCASVQLEGAIEDSCTAVVASPAAKSERSRLGFIEQLQFKNIVITQSDLLGAPRTDLLEPIEHIDVVTGLNEARKPLTKSVSMTFGVQSNTDLIPWIKEYAKVESPSKRAADEAKNARSQIIHMWKSIPGISSDFQRGKIPPTQTLVFGTLTSADAKFASEVEKTLASGGYDALTLAAFGKLDLLLKDPTADKFKVIQQAQEFNTARFISTYFRAYLRGGRFIQVSLDTDGLTKKISDKILDALKNDVQLNDQQKTKITDAIKDYIQKETCRESKDPEKTGCLLSRAFGDDSFVTRSGQSVQFAGVSVTIGESGKLGPVLTYPESTEFGPQLVRVLMEAVFDSHGLYVPAVSNATACKTNLYTGTNCLADVDIIPDAEPGSVAEQIKKLDMYAGQTEATVTAASSKLIRGLSIAALNNEAVAKSVETLAGVSARKIVEKALWSRYQQPGEACVAPGSVAVWVKK